MKSIYINRILHVLMGIALLMAALPLTAQDKTKEVKVKGVQGRWQVSDNITLKEAEERALMEAQKEALRQAGVMESVWSVFGQITSESGTELSEVYSQMNVLAIGGMMNITNKTVKEEWDIQARSLFKVVTIDATVRKGEATDRSYALELKGVSTVYKEGDCFQGTVRVRGTSSYLKIFWFDSDGGELIYPNDYEGNQLLAAEQTYTLPFSQAVDYRLEKKGRESEKINLMLVATKENIPFTSEEVSYTSVLQWIYNIPASQRCATYDMLLVQ